MCIYMCFLSFFLFVRLFTGRNLHIRIVVLLLYVIVHSFIRSFILTHSTACAGPPQSDVLSYVSLLRLL